MAVVCYGLGVFAIVIVAGEIVCVADGSVIPNGDLSTARGWPDRPTPGDTPRMIPTPTGLRLADTLHTGRTQPRMGLMDMPGMTPGVGASRQPRALKAIPVGDEDPGMESNQALTLP